VGNFVLSIIFVVFRPLFAVGITVKNYCLSERFLGQTWENFVLIGGSKGILQGGGNRGIQGGMGESNKLFDLGGMKSSFGPVGRGSNNWGQVNFPKAIGGGIAVAGEDGLVSVADSHVMLGESGNTVSITEPANGEKRVVNVAVKQKCSKAIDKRFYWLQDCWIKTQRTTTSNRPYSRKVVC